MSSYKIYFEINSSCRQHNCFRKEKTLPDSLETSNVTGKSMKFRGQNPQLRPALYLPEYYGQYS